MRQKRTVLLGRQRDPFEPGVVGRTPGRNSGMVLEMVVDEEALVGVHGFQLHGAPGCDDPRGDFLGFFDEAVVPGGAVVVDVKVDAGGARIVLEEDPVD